LAVPVRSSCFSGSATRLAPSSFPTRRSSDLSARLPRRRHRVRDKSLSQTPSLILRDGVSRGPGHRPSSGQALVVGKLGTRRLERSEEHTSELQSRENLVCRLLLEKKKYTVDA